MTELNATHAYFPGTGPAGVTCYSCKYLKPKAKMKNQFYCDKARQFIDRVGETKRIRSDSAACKYYDAKPAT